METRFTQTEVRNQGNKICGMASVTYNGESGSEFQLWEGTYERIAPGAFDRFLATQPPNVVCRVNHDENKTIARTGAGNLVLRSDSKGLYYEATPPDTTIVQDLRKDIDAGNMAGSSFSFIPDAKDGVEWRIDGKKEIRMITNAKLVDVAPCNRPAYSSTSVGVRSEDRAALEKERDDYRDRIETEKRIKRVESITR